MADLQNNFTLPVANAVSEATQELIDTSTSSSAEADAASVALQLARDQAAASRTQGIFASDPVGKAQESTAKATADLGPNMKMSKSTATSVPIMSTTGTTYATAGSLTDEQRAIVGPSVESTGSALQANRATNINKVKGDTSHKVSLSDGKQRVIFEVMPTIVENRQVQYEPVAPPQFPGAFQKYRGTDSVTWSIDATLVARNSLEARDNYFYIQTLRAWTMPFFGVGTANSEMKSKLGAPPPVLMFKALRKGIIEQVPVVITSLSWNWPRDVDYFQIATENATELDVQKGDNLTDIPFPAVMQVAISLVESFSTAQFNGFDLQSYYRGDMIAAYKPYNPQPNDNRTVVPKAEEPQKVAVLPTSLRGQNNYTTPTRLTPVLPSSLRGQNNYTTPAISEIKRTRRGGTASEMRNNVYVAREQFVSGKGSDFGGGGASGDF